METQALMMGLMETQPEDISEEATIHAAVDEISLAASRVYACGEWNIINDIILGWLSCTHVL